MSLYNILFGEQPDTDVLMTLLMERQSFSVGRFRDAWVEAEGDRPLIRVHTRNGGGNREDYEAENESMQDHPWYVRDCDDDYDCTYADFWFAPDPAEIDRESFIKLVEIAVPPVDMCDRWNAVIEAIKNAPLPGEVSR